MIYALSITLAQLCSNDYVSTHEVYRFRIELMEYDCKCEIDYRVPVELGNYGYGRKLIVVKDKGKRKSRAKELRKLMCDKKISIYQARNEFLK